MRFLAILNVIVPAFIGLAAAGPHMNDSADYSRMHSEPGWQIYWKTNGDFLGWNSSPAVPKAPPSVICNTSDSDKDNVISWLASTDKSLNDLDKKAVHCDLALARSGYITLPSLAAKGEGVGLSFARSSVIYRQANAARNKFVVEVNEAIKRMNSTVKLPKFLYDFNTGGFLETKEWTETSPLSPKDVCLDLSCMPQPLLKARSYPFGEPLTAAEQLIRSQADRSWHDRNYLGENMMRDSSEERYYTWWRALMRSAREKAQRVKFENIKLKAYKDLLWSGNEADYNRAIWMTADDIMAMPTAEDSSTYSWADTFSSVSSEETEHVPQTIELWLGQNQAAAPPVAELGVDTLESAAVDVAASSPEGSVNTVIVKGLAAFWEEYAIQAEWLAQGGEAASTLMSMLSSEIAVSMMGVASEALTVVPIIATGVYELVKWQNDLNRHKDNCLIDEHNKQCPIGFYGKRCYQIANGCDGRAALKTCMIIPQNKRCPLGWTGKNCDHQMKNCPMEPVSKEIRDSMWAFIKGFADDAARQIDDAHITDCKPDTVNNCPYGWWGENCKHQTPPENCKFPVASKDDREYSMKVRKEFKHARDKAVVEKDEDDHKFRCKIDQHNYHCPVGWYGHTCQHRMEGCEARGIAYERKDEYVIAKKEQKEYVGQVAGEILRENKEQYAMEEDEAKRFCKTQPHCPYGWWGETCRHKNKNCLKPPVSESVRNKFMKDYHRPSGHLLPVRHNITELPTLLFYNATLQRAWQNCELRLTTSVEAEDHKAKFACAKGGKTYDGTIEHSKLNAESHGGIFGNFTIELRPDLFIGGNWVSIKLSADERSVVSYKQLLEEFKDMGDGRKETGELNVKQWHLQLAKFIKFSMAPRKKTE
ncbi:Hypothetical protein R9X50_00439700 [Acrodontium crateriforme]|uniref:Uncharacterized protein n=1 Tax=Acrodontium crateriforme TaxID=150365 RepID=A0AAQ3M652_9PEZI|nr:Hypothetical protein R9X50_00439700 [Acrodontium crateriforme]